MTRGLFNFYLRRCMRNCTTSKVMRLNSIEYTFNINDAEYIGYFVCNIGISFRLYQRPTVLAFSCQNVNFFYFLRSFAAYSDNTTIAYDNQQQMRTKLQASIPPSWPPGRPSPPPPLPSFPCPHLPPRRQTSTPARRAPPLRPGIRPDKQAPSTTARAARR